MDRRSAIDKVQLVAEVARSPRVTIDMFGGPECRSVYELFVSRRRKAPILRLKTFGAALRSLDQGGDTLFAGKSFELMRRKVRRAQKLGYVVEQFDPASRVDEVMNINTSAPERQGKAIASIYIDRTKVENYHRRPGPWFGAFDRDGVLRAYAHTPVLGDFYLYSRILGDADHLNDGVMYLLVHDTMRFMHQRLHDVGAPHWAMYDMYIGGTDGLRQFKRRLGFSPARVSWRWLDDR